MHRGFRSRTYWFIAVIHGDFYSGWPIADKDIVGVSAKGYPAARNYALFGSEEDAGRFLALNRPKIESRCAKRAGFDSFAVSAYDWVEGEELTQVTAI